MGRINRVGSGSVKKELPVNPDQILLILSASFLITDQITLDLLKKDQRK
jgi:hypothetical protein